MPIPIIIGDIHGEHEKLHAVIRKALSYFGNEVEFYAVGDFINRGPNPKEVIELCVRYKVKGVIGNHEMWFCRLLSTGEYSSDEALHFMVGGKTTLDSYGLDIVEPQDQLHLVPDAHKEFLLNLPVVRKITVAGVDYWITHAGLPEGLANDMLAVAAEALEKQGQDTHVSDDLLMHLVENSPACSALVYTFQKKEDLTVYQFPSGAVQIFGHSVFDEPLDGGHFIALDTGCGRKKRTPNDLSAVALLPDGSRVFIQN